MLLYFLLSKLFAQSAQSIQADYYFCKKKKRSSSYLLFNKKNPFHWFCQLFPIKKEAKNLLFLFTPLDRILKFPKLETIIKKRSFVGNFEASLIFFLCNNGFFASQLTQNDKSLVAQKYESF